ncbi:unnamed protein product [Rotaria sp. Silwood1]|nr:unnamed protein product [Rotaria sp. Silwood1]
MGTITEFFRQHRYCISQKRIDEFSNDLENLLLRLYTKKLSRKLSLRAKREHKLIMSIRRYLRKYQQVILRRTDKSKVFHLGDAHDYQRKVLEYMQETEAYEEIISGVSPLSANLQQVTVLLNQLYHAEKPLITKKQYEAMYPKENETELTHLYFIPKSHKIGTPLRPIVAGIHAPAILISKYLDDSLRSVFNRVARRRIYINSLDLMKQLENYERQGHLLSTTKFITADVKNLYTMIPKGGALDALYRFCVKHGKNGKIGNLYVNTIIPLACLVLDTNCFVFDNKYYKQIRGGAMGSPFTMTLANIYMYEWEQSLHQHQQQRNQLYGQYIDDIFMTSNEPVENIKALLDRENAKDPNIRITYTIHDSVEFLDVLIENIQGQLKTLVFRKPAAEPYIVPIQTFDQERLNIEIALLLNGYPLNFIKRHLKQCFKNHNVMSIYQDLHAKTYKKLHLQLLDESLTYHTGSNPPEEQQQKQYAQTNQQCQTTTSKKQPDIIIHYQYESGPVKTFNSEFRKIWKKHFCYPTSSLNNVRLILDTRINKTIEDLRVNKKPPRNLLRNLDCNST